MSSKNKLPWYPQQPQRFIFTNISEACCEAKRWKHLSLLQSLPDLLQNLLRNPVEPDLPLHQTLGFAQSLPEPSPKPPSPEPPPEPCEPSPKRLCNQSLPYLLRNLLRNPLNLIWICNNLLRNLLRNLLLRNPVNLLRNGSAPKPPRPSPEPATEPVEPDFDLHQPSLEPSPEPCWTWPGSAPKLPWPSPEPSPEPCWTWPDSAPKLSRPSPERSLAPCWTWPASAPKPPRPSSEPSAEPCWTWAGSAPKLSRPSKPPRLSPELSPEPSTEPVDPDLALHKASQNPLRNLRLRNPVNLLRNGSAPKLPRPSPEP